MTVRCPRCGTLYRRPLRRGGDAYQCARCRHVFDAGGGAAPGDDEGVSDVADDEPAFVLGDDDADGDDDALREPEPPAVDDARPAGRAARPEPAAKKKDEDEPVAPSGNPAARFAFRSLVGVTLCYGAFSIYLVTHVGAARALFAQIPLIGTTLLETRLHPASVQLTNVRGEYQRVKGDRLVFVVKGSAVNASPIPVRGIQVEGRLTGAHEERQVVFCGASPRDVHDLSLREIALLQTLEPPADWAVGPSDQTDFLIVFANPPAELKDFSVEVVGVRAEPRRSAGTSRALGF
jgi:hypothetical protein